MREISLLLHPLRDILVTKTSLKMGTLKFGKAKKAMPTKFGSKPNTDNCLTIDDVKVWTSEELKRERCSKYEYVL